MVGSLIYIPVCFYSLIYSRIYLGRERRQQREIDKQELKKAIKYGKRERADSGRNGDRRWKFTYRGVVYITDDSLRHEITSWRIDESLEVYNQNIDENFADTHVVLVVDSSGSMRNNDIVGFARFFTYSLTHLLPQVLTHLLAY